MSRLATPRREPCAALKSLRSRMRSFLERSCKCSVNALAETDNRSEIAATHVVGQVLERLRWESRSTCPTSIDVIVETSWRLIARSAVSADRFRRWTHSGLRRGELTRDREVFVVRPRRRAVSFQPHDSGASLFRSSLAELWTGTHAAQAMHFRSPRCTCGQQHEY
jgi:hypothetical protein